MIKNKLLRRLIVSTSRAACAEAAVLRGEVKVLYRRDAKGKCGGAIPVRYGKVAPVDYVHADEDIAPIQFALQDTYAGKMQAGQYRKVNVEERYHVRNAGYMQNPVIPFRL